MANIDEEQQQELERLKQELERVKTEYAEFRTDSKDLEAEFEAELRVKDVELKRLSDMINIEKKERQTLQARLSNSECGGVELSKLRDEIAALRTAEAALRHSKMILENENEEMAQRTRELEAQLNITRCECEEALEKLAILESEHQDEKARFRDTEQELHDEMRDLVSEIKAIESRRTHGPLREPMTVPEAKEHEEECEGARHRQTAAASPGTGGSSDASAAQRGGGGREEAPAEAGAWLGAGQSGRSVSELIDKVQGLQDRLAVCRSRVGSLL